MKLLNMNTYVARIPLAGQ